MGCSVVDLCYLNESVCDASADATAADDAGGDVAEASSCDASDPCDCLPPLKQFSGCGSVQALLAQSPYAYWMGAGDANGRQLCRASVTDKSGGADVLVTGVKNWTDFYGGFAVDSQYAYLGYWYPSASLVRGSVDGGTLSALIQSLPDDTFALTARPDGLYWLDGAHDVCKSDLDGSIPPGDSGCGGEPFARMPSAPPWAPTAPLSVSSMNRDFLAVSDVGVYQTIYQTGATIAIPLDGGAATALALGATAQTRPIAANDAYVVWNESSGTGYVIKVVSPSGGAVATLVPNAASPGLAIDDTWAYFALKTQTAFQINRVRLAGGPAELVACAPPTVTKAPAHIAVDDEAVYFAGTNDIVYATPK